MKTGHRGIAFSLLRLKLPAERRYAVIKTSNSELCLRDTSSQICTDRVQLCLQGRQLCLERGNMRYLCRNQLRLRGDLLGLRRNLLRQARDALTRNLKVAGHVNVPVKGSGGGTAGDQPWPCLTNGMNSGATVRLAENSSPISRVGADHACAITRGTETLNSVMLFADTYDTDAGRVMAEYASMVYCLRVSLHGIVTLADTMDSDTSGIVDAHHPGVAWARRNTLNAIISGGPCITFYAGVSDTRRSSN